jgi:hypothetical protein
LSFDKIWELFHEIEKSRRYSSIEWFTFKNQLLGATPALTDKSIQEKNCTRNNPNLTYKQMQSGAGHDSQDMACCTDRNDFRTKCCWNQSFPKSLAKQLIWRMERTYCFKPY